MKIIKNCFCLLTLLICFPLIAQQSSNEKNSTTPAYISDDLFIFMHTGAGKNYRIAGSINAGTEIQLTGKKDNGFTQIIDDKDRVAWVEDKFVSSNPSLRHVIAQLNSKLATYSETESANSQTLQKNRLEITELKNENTALEQQTKALKKQLNQANEQLELQKSGVQQQWFYRGAIVLGLGLILGLILPLLVGKKKRTSSWS